MKKAGRPPAPPRPKPISFRPQTQQERDKYLALGGARWLRRMIEVAKSDAPAEKIQALRVILQDDIDRLGGRFGIRGHSSVDDDYFLALEDVVKEIDALLKL